MRLNADMTREALRDIAAGFMAHRIWLQYAWLDIKIRYRRSTLGPFWITLNLAIMVITLGLLYSKLFRVDVAEFLPYFASGITAWSLLSSILIDSTAAFVSAESMIRQIRAPFSLHIIRTLARNVIIFLHNMVVPIFCGLIFQDTLSWHLLSVLLSLILLSAIFFFISMIVAIFSTRFRDITQIVVSLMQVFMLFTPIFWMRSVIPKGMEYIYHLNPFYHFIELLRAPMLGQPANSVSVAFSLAALVILAAVCVPFFAFYRRRIPYWL